eukprot:1311763-Pyramimonas_sp.AAC.1
MATRTWHPRISGCEHSTNIHRSKQTRTSPSPTTKKQSQPHLGQHRRVKLDGARFGKSRNPLDL